MNIELLQQIIRETSASILLPHYHHVSRQYKPDGSVVTVADTDVQTALTSSLKQAYPDIDLMGEEMTSSEQQALLDSNRPFWCLDPIDGTSNFATGMPYFSVSLALFEKGQVQLGIVYDPIRDECFSAIKGQGAWLNGRPLQRQTVGLKLSQTIALVDFKRLPRHVSSRLLTDLPFGSQRNLGSIALELSWIAAGRAHIYLHGSQNLWDYAAAELIVRESGAYIQSMEPTIRQTASLVKRSACAAVDEPLFDEWVNYLTALPYATD